MNEKTIFISGGTSGINLGIARSFASSGAKVLIFGRDAAKVDAAAAVIRTPRAASRWRAAPMCEIMTRWRSCSREALPKSVSRRW